MTYPVGQPSDGASGAYVEGTVSDAQGQSEASIRAGIRSKIAGFGVAQNLFGGLFAGIAEWLTSLNALVDEQITQAGEITDGLTDLTNRVELLEGGAITVRTYAFNSTWTKPPGLIRLGVAVEGGGSAGRTGSTIAVNRGGLGGLSGGYRYQWFEKAEIDFEIGATESVIIGAGGATPSQVGGVSRFGSHVMSVAGVGAFVTIEGSAVSNSASGAGGNGGDGLNGNTGVQQTGGGTGGQSAFAIGGTGGTSVSGGSGGRGGDGADASLSARSRGNGGSGGGGGGGGLNPGTVGGRGGDGGFPSGGGGGGGGRSSSIGASDGAGGLAADGRVTLIEYTIGVA